MIKRILRSKLLVSAGTYGAINLINSAIPFLLLPILTRYLSPEDYGVVALFQILLGLTASVISLNCDTAIRRQFYKQDQIKFPKYIGNCLLVLLANTFASGLLVLMIAEPIGTAINFPSTWLWTVVFCASTLSMTKMILSVWQVNVNVASYARFKTSLMVLNIGLSCWFIISLQMDWQGRILGQLVAFLLFAILSLSSLWRNGWLDLTFDGSYVRHLVRYGAPLIPHTVGMLIIAATDRLLVSRLSGLSSVGVFTVGSEIGMVIGLLAHSFNYAWVPWLFARLKENNPATKIAIVKFTYLHAIAILAAAGMLSLAANWILWIMVAPEFRDAAIYVPWIAFGYAFNGMYLMACNYLYYSENTRLLACITVFVAVLNVVVSYALIKANGPIGAAQGTMISFLASFVLTAIFANRVHAMPWLFFKPSKSN